MPANHLSPTDSPTPAHAADADAGAVGARPWLGSGALAAALTTAAAGAALAASWQRWINPFVDSGREMDVPARLAAGERLYRDIDYYYGPAGPWLQSLALRACGGCRSWLPLEAACLLLSGAVLLLLHRLTAAAGSRGTAAGVTALTAALCLGAPRGGAFIFPYSASSLYALAGGLTALVAASWLPSWRRTAVVACGVGLAMAARLEIGAATALVLVAASWRSRAAADSPPPARAAAPELRAPPELGEPPELRAPPEPGTRALPSPTARVHPGPAWAGTGEVLLGLALGGGAWATALAGVPWHGLVAAGPFTHFLAMPPGWRAFYAQVAGLANPAHGAAVLAGALLLDALLLAACAWVRLPGLLFWPALTVATAVYAGGWMRWRPLAGDLPPLLLPLPAVAAAAALLLLRRPLDARGRARFTLCALAAALGARVEMGLQVGPAMNAFSTLPMPLLLATGGVLAADVLAPRLAGGRVLRRRLAGLAAALGAVFLIRLGSVTWGPTMEEVQTAAGGLRLPRREAAATRDALAHLAAHARAGDALASFPEAGFFNFVAGLRNPLRQEQLFPGTFDERTERQATGRLIASRPRFILLANRPTPEFGARSFGVDYATTLWAAIEAHYDLGASFGPAPPWAGVGSRLFFVHLYEPLAEPAANRR
jgi:hypothetical protein